MNHVFKVVKCRKTGGVKAVAEHARSGKKSKSLASLTLAIMAASGAAHAEITSGTNGGFNDVAIGADAISTGKNGIAIGAGAFTLPSNFDETTTRQMVGEINNIKEENKVLQQEIADKSILEVQYQQTIKKVEKALADIAKEQANVTQLRGELPADIKDRDEKRALWDEKQKEVTDKLTYLDRLDLSKYQAYSQDTIKEVAKEVMLYAEQGQDADNSLGLEFYTNYIDNYITSLAVNDWIKGHRTPAMSGPSVFNTEEKVYVNISSIMQLPIDSNRDGQFKIVSDSEIHTLSNEQFEKKIKDLRDSKAIIEAKAGTFADAIINNNWLLRKMKEAGYGAMTNLPEVMSTLVNYRLVDTETQYLRKQLVGVTSGTPEYRSKVSQIDALVKQKESDWEKLVELTGDSIRNNIDTPTPKTFMGSMSDYLRNRVSSYVSSLTNPTISANTISKRQIRTYLEETFKSVTYAKNTAESLVTKKEKSIDTSLKTIASLQPTVDELAAYDRAVEVRAQINATRDALAAKLKRLEDIRTNLSQGEGMLAIGTNAKSLAEYSTAIGANSEALGRDSVAIGKGASVSGISSTAIGTGNVVTGNNSGAFGDPNTVVANNSYAFGNNNTISIGADNSFVMGNNSVVADNASNSIVLGSNSSSTAANTVALGNNSVADRANTVSVGSASAQRNIINVADGTQDTDAINLSQLKTKGDLSAFNPIKSKIESNTTAASSNASELAKQDARLKTLDTDRLDAAALKTVSDQVTANTQAIDAQAMELASLDSSLADDAYVKAQDAIQDQEIKKSQDAQDALWQSSITGQENADKAIGDSIASTKTALDTIASEKADTSYVNAKDKAQDDIIATKADKSYVADKDNAQDALIAQKSNAEDVKAIVDAHAAQLDTKADANYVATQNAKQDEAIKSALKPFEDVDAGLQTQITSNDADIADLYEVKADKSYVDAQNKAQDDAFTASVEQLKNADNTSGDKLQDLEVEITERDDALAQSATEQADDIKGLQDTANALAEETKQIGDKLNDFELEFKANADEIRDKADKFNDESIARDNELDAKITANDEASRARDAEIDSTITVKNQESIERDMIINDRLTGIDNDALARDNALQDKLDTVESASIARDDDLQNQITVNNDASIARDDDLQNQITVNNNASIERDNIIVSNIDSNEKASIDRDTAIETLLAQVDKNAKDSDQAINITVDANEVASLERDNAIADTINSTDEQLQAADTKLAEQVDSNHLVAKDLLNKVEQRVVDVNTQSIERDNELQAQIVDNQAAITSLQEVDEQIKATISDLEMQARDNNAASVDRDEQIRKNANEIDANSFSRDKELMVSVKNVSEAISQLKTTDEVLANNDAILDANIKAEFAAAEEANSMLASQLDAVNERATTEFSRLQAFNPVQDAIFREMQANQDALLATKLNSADFLKYANQQAEFDNMQFAGIEQNRYGAEQLDKQVKSIDKELSAAIASSIALSQMPNPTTRSDHYVTVGTGNFNGESALSLGLTGTSAKGNISYKIGGSWADGSGSTFGLGAGYYWK